MTPSSKRKGGKTEAKAKSYSIKGPPKKKKKLSPEQAATKFREDLLALKDTLMACEGVVSDDVFAENLKLLDEVSMVEDGNPVEDDFLECENFLEILELDPADEDFKERGREALEKAEKLDKFQEKGAYCTNHSGEKKIFLQERMDSTGEGEGAVLQLQQESANEKFKELESVVGESQSLVSDSGLRGKEPEQESGAQADLRPANADCANCKKLQREVEELRSILSRKEGPPEELTTAQGTAAVRERASLSAGGKCKRQFENSEEPPREMRRESRRASEEAKGDGRSALHLAALRGDLARVRGLIARGADTRLLDRFGQTPLHCALLAGKEQAALLLAGVDLGNDIQDCLGFSPLHIAALMGLVGAVRTFLDGGATTRIRDDFGMTPLHSALFRRKEAAAEILAEADGGIELRDCRGRTPLHHAAEKGVRRVVATLLRDGVDPHPRDDGGKYPLHMALRGGRRDGVPEGILASCALKGIAMDWAELGLAPGDLWFCFEVTSVGLKN